MTTENQPDTGATDTALTTTSTVKTGSVGNLNAATNGNCIVRTMPDSELPKRYRFINNRVRQFRIELEEAVVESKGEITVMAASWINAAVVHEKGRQFCAARLRAYLDGSRVEEGVVLALSGAIGKAAEGRCRAIEKLSLPLASRSNDPWADLYRIPDADTQLSRQLAALDAMDSPDAAGQATAAGDDGEAVAETDAAERQQGDDHA